MPAGHPPARPHPSKPFRTYADAAKEGQLILLNCKLCHRSVYFLAQDLAAYIGPKHPVHVTPLPCSKCKKAEYVSARVHQPTAGDYGRLPVRRLVKVVQVSKWRNCTLGVDPL